MEIPLLGSVKEISRLNEQTFDGARDKFPSVIVILKKRSRSQSRATPNEEPAPSLSKGPVQLASIYPG